MGYECIHGSGEICYHYVSTNKIASPKQELKPKIYTDKKANRSRVDNVWHAPKNIPIYVEQIPKHGFKPDNTLHPSSLSLYKQAKRPPKVDRNSKPSLLTLDMLNPIDFDQVEDSLEVTSTDAPVKAPLSARNCREPSF